MSPLQHSHDTYVLQKYDLQSILDSVINSNRRWSKEQHGEMNRTLKSLGQTKTNRKTRARMKLWSYSTSATWQIYSQSNWTQSKSNIERTLSGSPKNVISQFYNNKNLITPAITLYIVFLISLCGIYLNFSQSLAFFIQAAVRQCHLSILETLVMLHCLCLCISLQNPNIFDILNKTLVQAKF